MSFPNPDDVQIAKNDPSMQVVKIDHEAVAYMGLANNRAPFDNQKVRQAIHMAVPKDDISAAFFADVGETADQFMPSNVMGYSKAISGYPYDPARAKALLAEAGYPDGIDVDLWYMGIPRSYFPDPKSVATALSASLGQIGVRVNLRTEEWGQYVADMTASDKFDMWLAGWSNDNGEPDSFFSRLLAHHNPETDKPSWNNEDLANRIQSGAQNFNREERTATYVDIMSDLQDQSPWIPITRMSDVVLMTAGVEGFVGEAIGVAYDFSKVRFTG